jgi:thiol:disulfide interchange protein DsbD
MMRVRWTLVFVLVVHALMPARAAQTPVVWSVDREATTPVKAGQEFEVVVGATVDFGWHLYALTQTGTGPLPTSITLEAGSVFQPAGAPRFEKPIEGFDPNFNIVTQYYDDQATFRLPVRVADGAPDGEHTLTVAVRFQTCNDTFCLPARTERLSLAVVVGRVVPRAASASPTVAPPVGAPAPAASVAPVPSAPVTAAPAVSRGRVPVPDLAATDAATTLGAYAWLAAAMGALSLLTPCVFPMVPITVSYFTGRGARSRREATTQALLYGAGIVLTFAALGMTLALVFGAAGLNRLAANPWLNIAITIMFLAFAASLFGGPQLSAPSSMLTAVTTRANRAGAAGALLMGLAFTLTSFTCTAPFLGTLLVVASQGDWVWPLVGMTTFALVFALPFIGLALVPRWLQSLPRAGTWMLSLKAVMGLLEVAAAMKFLSNADLVWGWGVFTRDVVIAIWVVVAVVMAAYLAGGLALGHAPRLARPQGTRWIAVTAAATLALWLSTGVTGRRLGELEAFLPPADAEDLGTGRELSWIVNDYDAALTQATAAGGRVLVDFTGYTCTNCRWMEANMFTRPDVAREMARYTRVRLYTDGLGEPYERYQALEQEMLGTVALPFYAVLEADGTPVVAFGGLTRDEARFLTFLRRGQTDSVPTATSFRP